MLTEREFTTSVMTDWDPDLDGKQMTYLKIPYSRDNSAWGGIWIPITQIKNGEGDTILFLAGVHGGEYEGPITLMKLARELTPEAVSGRVIILPCANIPAVQEGKRVSPLDNRDLNRSFPGRPNGTVTEVIAHYIHDYILPHSNVVVDLHAGGQSLSLAPYASMHFLKDKAQFAKTYEALCAFGAPYQLIMSEFSGDGLIDYAVEHLGKVFVCAELGGAGIISPKNVAVSDRGVRNIMRHFGVIEGLVEESGHPPKQMYVSRSDQYVHSSSTGIFEPFKELGDPVTEGEIIGRVHHIQDLASEPPTYYSNHKGILLGMRAPGCTDRGDCLAMIATENKL